MVVVRIPSPRKTPKRVPVHTLASALPLPSRGSKTSREDDDDDDRLFVVLESSSWSSSSSRLICAISTPGWCSAGVSS